MMGTWEAGPPFYPTIIDSVRVQDISTFKVAIASCYDNMTLLFSYHSGVLEKILNFEKVYNDIWSYKKKKIKGEIQHSL